MNIPTLKEKFLSSLDLWFNERVDEMVKDNKFLEYALVHNNYYGTPKDFVHDQIEKGEIVLLEIDTIVHYSNIRLYLIRIKKY